MGRRVERIAALTLAFALVAAPVERARADNSGRSSPDFKGSNWAGDNGGTSDGTSGSQSDQSGSGSKSPGAFGRPANAADWRKWFDMTHAGQDLARAARAKGEILPFGAMMKKAFGPGAPVHALAVALHRDLFGGLTYVVTTIDKAGHYIETTISGRDGRVLKKRMR